MSDAEFGLLRFEEGYFERIWGGQKLHTHYGKSIPQDRPIGEAWMISDHEQHESVVVDGPHKGETLRTLLAAHERAILGTQANLTIHGRFPLLLKILDANDVLSVQVHPDDDAAKQMGEPDVGKTEMWHVLETEPGSELICGMDQSVTSEQFAQGIEDGSLESLMTTFPVEPGTSVFVPAGTVHAIGAGIVLAEIQQNSDLTYRIYDWGRVDANGKGRTLHVDKALKATHFGSTHGGPAQPLAYGTSGATCTVLAACRYFSAELISVTEGFERAPGGRSFHILLGKTGSLEIAAGGESRTLCPGEAVLVPGCAERYAVSGTGSYLDYYVPDLKSDVFAPLKDAGHDTKSIIQLGGPANQSDLNGLE